MAKKELKQTQSSYSNDPKTNRANEVRRDNDIIRTPKITIEDIDFAIFSYIRDVIRPQIKENGQMIDVPVMWANGEKWAQVQARGFMRDRKGKVMTPVFSIRRTNLVERDELKALGVNQNPDSNNYVFENKYTKNNRYSRLSVLQNTSRGRELYISTVPEFVNVSYEFVIWTEYTEQLNAVIEQIVPTNGFAYGTTFKFPTYLRDVSIETTNVAGEDRVVRATLPAEVKGTLLMPYELQASNLQKRFSPKKVVFGNESDGTGLINPG